MCIIQSHTIIPSSRALRTTLRVLSLADPEGQVLGVGEFLFAQKTNDTVYLLQHFSPDWWSHWIPDLSRQRYVEPVFIQSNSHGRLMPLVLGLDAPYYHRGNAVLVAILCVAVLLFLTLWLYIGRDVSAPSALARKLD